MKKVNRFYSYKSSWHTVRYPANNFTIDSVNYHYNITNGVHMASIDAITIINNIFEIRMAAESTYHRSKYDINQQHDIFDELINYYEES